MRVLVQRSGEASVTISGSVSGEIKKGMVVLLGIAKDDTETDADWLIQKITGLRIFNDEDGKMNLAISEIDGEFLVISQFTLHASTKKGNRPSFINAARPEKAIPLYEYFVNQLQEVSKAQVATGEFGADMKVSILNDGPVTIWIDSNSKE